MRDKKALLLLVAVLSLTVLAGCLIVPVFDVTGPVRIYNPSDEQVVVTSQYFANPNLSVTIPARSSALVSFAPTSGYVDLYLDGKCYVYDVRVRLSSSIRLIPDAYWLPVTNDTNYTLSLIRFIPNYTGDAESAVYDKNGRLRSNNTTIYPGDTVAFKLSNPTSFNTRGYLQAFLFSGDVRTSYWTIPTREAGKSSQALSLAYYLRLSSQAM